MLRYNRDLKAFSRALRRNMTDAETLLWSRSRRKQLRGLPFYRQRIVGDHIVDFFRPRIKPVLEVDGGQHFTTSGKAKDRAREDFLRSLGLSVLRVSDLDVFENLEGVVQRVWEVAETAQSPQSPLSKKGGAINRGT
jgi:very-short-patch-repair endonuclease